MVQNVQIWLLVKAADVWGSLLQFCQGIKWFTNVLVKEKQKEKVNVLLKYSSPTNSGFFKVVFSY